MKRARGQRNRRGFTMAEVLTVIAIFAVLAAVAFPAVAQIQKRLDMARLDEYARQIFLAAQNEVTAMKASGRLEGFAEALKDQKVDTEPADYPEKAAPWKNLRIVSDGDTAAATYLLRSGSALTDATQGGHFLLELNPATGDVYSAFYAQDIIDYTSVQATCLKDRNRDTRQPSQLGYYGGSIGTSGPVGVPQTFRPKLNIVNGEELYLTVTCDGLIALRPTQEKLSLTVTVTDEHKKTWSKIWRGGDPGMFLNGGNLRVQLVLDSLDSTKAFAAVTAGSLTPGDNLTITAAMAYANDGVHITGAATPVTVNSLFGDGTSADKINVSHLRHLNNLRADIYTARFGNTLITQTAPIDFDIAKWEKADYCSPWEKNPLTVFSSIENETLLTGVTYDGKNNPITGLPIVGTDFAGLFADVKEGSTLKNIRLADCSVKATLTDATTASCAGALAGIVTDTTVENCGVYLNTKSAENVFFPDMDQRIKTYAVTGTGYAGGLIGRTTGGTVTNSFAALNVTGGYSSGGLIGVQGESIISNCYASGTVETPNYLGGLVGYATGEIIDCYSTANVTGNYVGGLVGGSGNITIKNCKVYGRVEGKAKPGGVLGTVVEPGAQATCTNCTYLKQSGYNQALTSRDDVTPQTYASMKAESPNALTGAHPYQEELLNTAFPFPLLKIASGTIMPHYGAWPEEIRMKTLLVYYEQYEPNDYGYHAVVPADATGDLIINTLKDKLCVEDGYALVTVDQLKSFTYARGEDIEEEPDTAQVSEIANPDDAMLLQSGISLNFENGTSAVTGANVYRLPFELQFSDRQEDNQFYDELKLTTPAGESTFYYCPDFAKNALNPAVGATTPQNPKTAFVRSARQLNNLGRGDEYWINEPDKLNLSFQQETDIDLELYVKHYCGKTEYLMDEEYSNQSIGNAKTQFNTTYNGGTSLISHWNVPLFGTNKGTLKNIRLTDVTLTSTQNVAALCLNNGSSIKNCFATGIVNGSAAKNAAGLVYYNSGAITESAYTGDVTSIGESAGLVYQNEGRIADSYVKGGTITARTTTAGFVGISTKTINRCYANCTVISNTGDAAAFVGAQKFGTISNCYAVGFVQAKNGIASGFKGIKKGVGNGELTNCYTVATLEGGTWYPLVIKGNDGKVTRCYWATDVTHQGYKGDSAVGTGKTLAELKRLTKDELSDQFETATAATTHPDTLKGAYPYRKLKGLDHYGDWPTGKNGKIGVFQLYQISGPPLRSFLKGVSIDLDDCNAPDRYTPSGTTDTLFYGVLFDDVAMKNLSEWTAVYNYQYWDVLAQQTKTDKKDIPLETKLKDNLENGSGLTAFTLMQPIPPGELPEFEKVNDITLTHKDTITGKEQTYVFPYDPSLKTFTYKSP